MAGVPERRDPAQLRVSDADRHQVAELLREAAGEGRIDLDELDERLEATFAAKTYADLVPITVDLPVQQHAPASAPATRGTTPATTTYETSLALMGSASRKGAWLVPERHTAFSMMGGVDLDLREATFASREVTIVANTIMGAVDIVVDAHTVVVVDGVGLMGSFEQGRDRVEPQLSADSPVVRVKGFALMGSVTVVRKGPPRTPLRQRLTGG
jgi:hypothetical protein